MVLEYSLHQAEIASTHFNRSAACSTDVLAVPLRAALLVRVFDVFGIFDYQAQSLVAWEDWRGCKLCSIDANYVQATQSDESRYSGAFAT
jgi:hypothetical protein